MSAQALKRGPRGSSQKVGRERILAAARAELMHVGPMRFKVRAVARRIPCDSSLVHYHFGSREALLREATGARRFCYHCGGPLGGTKL